MKLLKHLAIAVLLAGAASAASTIYDTSLTYYFSSGSNMAAPDVASGHGSAANASITMGAMGSGWRAPSSGYFSGVNQDGAWDLGKSGTIVTTFECAPPLQAGQFYRVTYQIQAVAYSGLIALPSLINVGNATSSTLVAADTVMGGSAGWYELTWTGTIDMDSNQLSFGLQAPAGNTSIIDKYVVTTSVVAVPEPSAFLMVLLPAFAWMIRRKR